MVEKGDDGVASDAGGELCRSGRYLESQVSGGQTFVCMCKLLEMNFGQRPPAISGRLSGL